jgi:hypothetical protein
MKLRNVGSASTRLSSSQAVPTRNGGHGAPRFYISGRNEF